MFKKGDIIKCIHDGHDAHAYCVTEGTEYVVNAVERHHGVIYLKVIGDDDRAQVLLSSMFTQMGREQMTHEQMAEKLRKAGWSMEPPERKPKWPSRVTSSKTECAYATCPNDGECMRGCTKQRPITWDDAPEVH
jgi:hypothetical protein